MKITVTSDLHGHYPETTGGDLLIIAGDMTGNDREPQWRQFYDWLKAQKYKKKIYIAGNHDNFLSQCLSSKEDYKKLDMPVTNTEYLRDSDCEYMGFKIWGSPWTADFPGINPDCCAFTLPWRDPAILNERWNLIPDDTNILITHTPPFGILDRNYEGALCGSRGLTDRIKQLKNLRLHVFGHIHESYGFEPRTRIDGGSCMDPMFVNASHVNGAYEPVNDPVDIEIVC